MAWIYKISNDFDDKIYIGMTKNTPECRFQEHWHSRFSDTSYLHYAMALHGKEHFFVEGIEEVSEEEMGEREIYYIQKYNSLAPNGYNLAPGGENPPIHRGSKNVKSKLTEEQEQELFNDLSHYDLNFAQIANKYGISQSQVERINKGEYRHQDNIDYPIRKMKRDQYIIKCIIEDLQAGILTQTELEEKYQIRGRTTLYDINNGLSGSKNFPQSHYPIRSGIVNRVPLYLSKPVETISVIGE